MGPIPPLPRVPISADMLPKQLWSVRRSLVLLAIYALALAAGFELGRMVMR